VFAEIKQSKTCRYLSLATSFVKEKGMNMHGPGLVQKCEPLNYLREFENNFRLLHPSSKSQPLSERLWILVAMWFKATECCTFFSDSRLNFAAKHSTYMVANKGYSLNCRESFSIGSENRGNLFPTLETVMSSRHVSQGLLYSCIGIMWLVHVWCER